MPSRHEDPTKRLGRVVAGTFVRGRHLAGRRVRSLRRRALDPRRIEGYVGTHGVRKLQIGTGPNPLAGWLNTDVAPDTYPEHRGTIVFLDAAKPFPLDDMTFDYVFSEHQIEHIPEPVGHAMVAECFRILRPGGRIRIATPDLGAILGLYQEGLNEPERHYVDWVMRRFRPNVHSGNRSCYVINHMFTDHKHRFIYDYETLVALLTGAGFVDPDRCSPGESSDPELRRLETHGQAIGDERVNSFETMVVEAVRPPLGGGGEDEPSTI
jgi:predicted SAM-dependent methyltransferase